MAYFGIQVDTLHGGQWVRKSPGIFAVWDDFRHLRVWLVKEFAAILPSGNPNSYTIAYWDVGAWVDVGTGTDTDFAGGIRPDFVKLVYTGEPPCERGFALRYPR